MVAYENVEDATKAYKEYNKGELDGNVLVITYLPSSGSGSREGKSSQPGKLTVINQDGKKIIKKS